MKFPIKDFFSKCDQIPRKLRKLKKSLMENFIFRAAQMCFHSLKLLLANCPVVSLVFIASNCVEYGILKVRNSAWS